LKDRAKGPVKTERPGWRKSGKYSDIVYQTWEGIAKITINRPEVRNAFRPTTVFEMSRAFEAARDDPKIGVIILTGAGTEAFCSGGDQRIRGDDGYIDPSGTGRLNVLDLQVQIHVPDTKAPKVISMVGTMRNLVSEVLPLASFAEALAALREGRAEGKIVLRVE